MIVVSYPARASHNRSLKIFNLRPKKQIVYFTETLQSLINHVILLTIVNKLSKP
jgi:hypothetical protein